MHSAIGQACIRPAGKTILRVQRARNVFRRLNPEFIEFDLAPDAIKPASLDDLMAEVASYEGVLQQSIREWVAHARWNDATVVEAESTV